ncbi:MAG: tetratricopeptide repeat protein [Cyclobacteriaceae bacterium]
MLNNRLEQLLDLLEDDPNDPFNLYAVAIEYKGTEPIKSIPFFDKLLQNHPEYLPGYYHAAALYAEFSDNEKAIALYQQGISLAIKQQNQHALRELNNAMNELILEE